MELIKKYSDIKLEMVVIARILSEKKRVELLLQLHEDFFTDIKTKTCFQAIVQDNEITSGQLAKVRFTGGTINNTFLVDCNMELSKDWRTFKDYVEELKNLYTKRNLLLLSDNIVKKIDSDNTKLITSIEKSLSMMNNSINLEDGSLQNTYEKLKERKEVYPFEWKTLNNWTGGIGQSEIMVIGAESSGGKSYLVLQMCLYFANMQLSTLFFSTEMGKDTNLIRLNYINGKPLKDESIRLYDKITTLEDIFLEVKRQKYINTVDIVIIDQLQDLDFGGVDEYKAITEACRQIKAFALKEEVVMIIVSQLNRESQKTKDRSMTSFHGSGSIEKMAQIALILKGNEDDGRFMLVAKNRGRIMSRADGGQYNIDVKGLIAIDRKERRTIEKKEGYDVDDIKYRD